MISSRWKVCTSLWLNILIWGPSFFYSSFFLSLCLFLFFFLILPFSFLLLSSSSWFIIYNDLSKRQCTSQLEPDNLSLSSWKLWLKKLYSHVVFLSHKVSHFKTSGQSFPWYIGGPLTEGAIFRVTILNLLFQASHGWLYLKIIANWKLKDMFICDVNKAPKGEPRCLHSFSIDHSSFSEVAYLPQQQIESFILNWLPCVSHITGHWLTEMMGTSVMHHMSH